MPDPLERGAWLRPLPVRSPGTDPLPARASAASGDPGLRRAAQLRSFLLALHGPGAAELEPDGRIDLVVLARSDWRRVARHPYGPPFTRTRGRRATIVVPAVWPAGLRRRLEPLLLEAARRGAPPPGDARELLDLLSGHEWGHAVANLSGLRSRVAWLDELIATRIFLLALRDAGLDDPLARFLAWARVQVEGRGGRAPRPLGAFGARADLAERLWFQGRFALRAGELLAEGWEPLRELRRSLPAGRGEVARAVVAIEPSFRPWFATFAPGGGGAGGGDGDGPGGAGGAGGDGSAGGANGDGGGSAAGSDREEGRAPGGGSRSRG